MHAALYNEAIFELALRPRTPLLIKAGRSGEEALDPTLPEMSFVRMQRPGQQEEEVYLPGSSLRGVLRSHAEKLLRSVKEGAACDPTRMGGGKEDGTQDDRKACFAGRSNTEAIDGPTAYLKSCYACKLFGNTALAGRVRVGDLYLSDAITPVLARRYGVAIDRVTGAVAQGPFEIEILTEARFVGRLTIRNFTLGQLGLLAAALLDMGDGYAPLGYGKSRGLGRVQLTYPKVTIRTLQPTGGALVGVGALATAREQANYKLPVPENERLNADALDGTLQEGRQRGFYTLQSSGAATVKWLEAVVERWPKEVMS